MLENELKYFNDNKKELLAKYKDRYVVIVGSSVVGVFNTENEAYIDSIKKYELGSFLIQHCDSKGEYNQTFHSRVTFA